jgi:hypothetical protein
MRLEWRHVDLDAGVAVFNLRKGGDNALVALTSHAAAGWKTVRMGGKREAARTNRGKADTRSRRKSCSFRTIGSSRGGGGERIRTAE